MLARLLQAVLLGLMLLAAAVAARLWSAGEPLWAAISALLILFIHAPVLAFEFALLRLAHGPDPAPRAGVAQLLSAWWAEVRAVFVVYFWRQPFRSPRWPDHLPESARGRRGVLLLHGFVCNRGLWNPWLRKLRDQDVPVIALSMEPLFSSISAYRTQIESAVTRIEQATGLAPVIVAHSMGGLALRLWWAEQEGDGRVHHAITLGSPHRGTWLARFALTRNSRQMSQGSAWLSDLQRQEASQPAGRALRITCFYSHCDNIVFPARMATLPGANNRHLLGVAHLQMADRPEPWAELQFRLSRSDPTSG